jgi:hypothetical protein
MKHWSYQLFNKNGSHHDIINSACKGSVLKNFREFNFYMYWSSSHYRGADKSLAQPGIKQATATEDFDVHISYL